MMYQARPGIDVKAWEAEPSLGAEGSALSAQACSMTSSRLTCGLGPSGLCPGLVLGTVVVTDVYLSSKQSIEHR